MRHKKELRNGAQTQSRAARKPQPINLSDRLGFSPAEFAALNGKSATWGYRRIYHGDVKVISTAGRILIPRTEVDAFLARADQYNPKAKARQAEGGE